MTRSRLIDVLSEHLRMIVKVAVEMPGKGKIWVQVNKNDYAQILMREYEHGEETRLIADIDDGRDIIFIRDERDPL